MNSKNELPSNALDSTLQVFDQRAKDYESYSTWSRDEALYRLCTAPLADISHSAWCVELACGTGVIARRNYAETGRKWTMLDISARMGRNMGLGMPQFLQADATALPLKTGAFGFAVMRSALQFMNYEKALAEARRILSDTSCLVIAQKTIPADVVELRWYEDLYWLRNATAQVLWSEETLGNSIKNSGLRITQTTHYVERRRVPLERWITKDGTTPPQNLAQVRNLILNTPSSVITATNQLIKDDILEYDRVWAVLYCEREMEKNTKGILSPNSCS